MNIAEARRYGSKHLQEAGIETASLDAALLLAHVLVVDRSWLLAHPETPLTPSQWNAYRALLEERRKGLCVAYLTGHREFMGLDFIVTPDVLVPRPETEGLVELALGWLGDLSKSSATTGNIPLRVLDLCTGSGCIAVTIKRLFPFLEVWASDISERALAIAQKNAQRLVGPGTIHFCQGDLFENIPGTFQCIVTNPPYVPRPLISHLSREVQQEPLCALDGGDDGLDLIRRIIAMAPSYLEPGGALFLESDSSQIESIRTLLHKAGFIGIDTYSDLAGLPRVSRGIKP
ncbi:MAG: peptide chain release factor N(5)-glutamine methyltransferase [Treponemataceae bacterium]|nr:peptide chain release factor N(5)-glutamine methyltransferase [Treponemataceae bacterium]HOJ99988.1 peptide chain release factor N(5)-glutamine methyltransferase [Termitinemataceae bacterium]HOM22993.1 peptide chain release factor N(5)-glutamine methyltransferase [Termitinemataceae bacterium]HPQ00468.1 peptide chain release factor N(5)-glutamine methyltransferase [Termitinemataceae bacterium]